MVDRLYADHSTMTIYDNSKIMGYSTENKVGRKQQFFVDLGLGYMFGEPTPLSKKDLMFLEKDMKEDEVALLWAITIKEKGSIEHVQGKEEVYKIAEEYANTGIKYLDKIEKESSFDNYLKNFEKKALKELKKIEQENED